MLELEGDPAPGDPWVVSGLARSWASFAAEVEAAERGVRSLAADGAVLAWVGAAGRVFQEAIGAFPDDLAKCKDSYRRGAEALRRWSGELDGCQVQADRALVSGRAARADLDAAAAGLAVASGAASAADAASRRLGEVPEPDAGAVRSAVRDAQVARSRVESARSRVGDAQARLDAARRLALDARSVREDRGRAAARAIDEAASVGIGPESFWESLKDVAGRVWDAAVTVAKVVVVVLAIVAIIIGGPLLWGILLGLSALILADTLWKYHEGEASGWDVALAALGCIPGGRGLTTMAALKTAFRTSGAIGATTHVGAAAGAAARSTVTGMAQSVRGAAAGARTLGAGLPGALRDVRILIAETPDGLRIPAGLDTSGLRTLMSEAQEARRGLTGAAKGSPFHGPWTGENGLYLTADENLSVGQLFEKATEAEPVISAHVRAVVAKLPHGDVVGWEARLKTPSSLQDKVAGEVNRATPAAADVSHATSRITDAVRYTISSPAADYADTVHAAVRELRSIGLEPVGWKNFWGGAGYQGINSTWREPSTGRVFELQFHTPESFHAKSVTHAAYEEIRRGAPDPDLVAQRTREQDDVFSKVPVPPGAIDVSRLGG